MVRQIFGAVRESTDLRYPVHHEIAGAAQRLCFAGDVVIPSL
jgi:hypothetical protein